MLSISDLEKLNLNVIFNQILKQKVMSTQLIKVDFNIELAKKISAGEISGKITTRDSQDVEIIKFNKKGDYPIVALVGKDETIRCYSTNGDWDMKYNHGAGNNYAPLDLVLQIPQRERFKQGDIIKVDKIIFILEEYKSSTSALCYVIFQSGTVDFSGTLYGEHLWDKARLATDEEKISLFEAMAFQESQCEEDEE